MIEYDEMEERIRFRRTFSHLHASGGVLTEVFEMTTRKRQKTAPRAARRVLLTALIAALIMALAVAAYAADLFGIRALLVPGTGRVSLTQFQDMPESLAPATYKKAANFREAWAEWTAWRDEYVEKHEPEGSVGCGYDRGYGVRDETMGKKLEEIAEKYGLRFLGDVSVAWSSDTTGITGEGFYTNEELAEKTAEFAGSGNIFAETPVGFDKVYWFPEGNFGVSWYYALPGGEWITCYCYSSRYDVLTNGSEVGAADVDTASFTARSHTAPDGTELTILSNGREAYIYAWLENSFFAEHVNGEFSEVELTNETLNAIADMLIYSRIGK